MKLKDYLKQEQPKHKTLDQYLGKERKTNANPNAEDQSNNSKQ